MLPFLGPLQVGLGSNQHSKTSYRLGVEGLCEVAQVRRLALQVKAARLNGYIIC